MEWWSDGVLEYWILLGHEAFLILSILFVIIKIIAVCCLLLASAFHP